MAEAGTQEGGRRPVKKILVALGVIVLLAIFPWKPMGGPRVRPVFEPVWQAKLGSLLGTEIEGLFVDGPRVAAVVRGGMGGCEGIVLDRASGDTLATKTLGSTLEPITSALGPWPGSILVYGYSDSAGVQLLQANDFSQVWTKPHKGWVGCWSDWGEQVVLASADYETRSMKLLSYRRKDGQTKELADVPMAYGNQMDILGVGDKLVVTLDGEPLRTLTAAGKLDTVAPDPLSEVGLARGEDVLLVGSSDTVTCREVPSLTQRWSVKPDHAPPPGGASGMGFQRRPLLAGQGVVVTSDAQTDEVIALKLTSGAEQWRTKLSAPIVSQPLLQAAGGFVVLTNEEKTLRLHWLDAASGAELGTLDVPAKSAYKVQLASAEGCVYVAHGRQVDCWRLVRPASAAADAAAQP